MCVCVPTHTQCGPVCYTCRLHLSRDFLFVTLFQMKFLGELLMLTKQTLFKPPEVSKAELAIAPSEPEACVVSCGTRRLRLELIRKGVAPHAAASTTVRDEMEATEDKKKPHPPLLAAPSRYSTAWARRSTRLPQLQPPPPPPPIPRCSQTTVTDSSRPPSALRAPPLTCDVRAPNSHHVMTHKRCPASFDCVLVASLKG